MMCCSPLLDLFSILSIRSDQGDHTGTLGILTAMSKPRAFKLRKFGLFLKFTPHTSAIEMEAF